MCNLRDLQYTLHCTLDIGTKIAHALLNLVGSFQFCNFTLVHSFDIISSTVNAVSQRENSFVQHTMYEGMVESSSIVEFMKTGGTYILVE